jgi:hypothetical protein
MDEPRICGDPDCDRPVQAHGLCQGHARRLETGSTKTGPLNTAELHIDEPHIACPADLLPLADAIAEIDARAILRVIWPHLLEASLAGLEPFTLGEAS